MREGLHVALQQPPEEGADKVVLSGKEALAAIAIRRHVDNRAEGMDPAGYWRQDPDLSASGTQTRLNRRFRICLAESLKQHGSMASSPSLFT